MHCQVEPFHANCRIHILYNDQLQMNIPKYTTREGRWQGIWIGNSHQNVYVLGTFVLLPDPLPLSCSSMNGNFKIRQNIRTQHRTTLWYIHIKPKRFPLNDTLFISSIFFFPCEHYGTKWLIAHRCTCKLNSSMWCSGFRRNKF